MRPPFGLSLFLTVVSIATCAYLWFASTNPGRFVASAFCLIGIATYGTHAVMDLIVMRRRAR